MSDAQSVWHLGDGRALTLAGSAEVRRLSVGRGRVWLTVSGTAAEPAKDCWLEAGQAVALAPGQTAVLEGWPVAEFELLVPPAAAQSGRGLLGRRLFGGRLLGR